MNLITYYKRFVNEFAKIFAFLFKVLNYSNVNLRKKKFKFMIWIVTCLYTFEFYVSMSKFEILDDITLRTYSNHILLIKIVDQTNHVNFNRHDFIATNMMNIELILKLSWLRNQNFNIDWFTQTIRWRFFDESNDKS